MNPAETRLLENLNSQLTSLTKKVTRQDQQIGVLKDSYRQDIKALHEKLDILKEGYEGLALNFTPFAAEVVLPEIYRNLPQPGAMDFVDDVMGNAKKPTNPYPVEHGDQVLVVSGITNKKGEVVVSTEAGRVLWPLPATLFKKLIP
jgi:hypothetical protein